MPPSKIFDVKQIDLEISVAHRSFPYDVRLCEYALMVKEGPADKVAAIKGLEAHVSVHHLKELPISERTLSRAS